MSLPARGQPGGQHGQAGIALPRAWRRSLVSSRAQFAGGGLFLGLLFSLGRLHVVLVGERRQRWPAEKDVDDAGGGDRGAATKGRYPGETLAYQQISGCGFLIFLTFLSLRLLPLFLLHQLRLLELYHVEADFQEEKHNVNYLIEEKVRH